MDTGLENQSNALDSLDQAVLASLSVNVRRSVSDIASQLAVSTPTIKRRIDRMLDEGKVRLTPVLDLHAAGYEYLMMIGVRVENRSPLLVATDIAQLPQALTVNVVLGHFDIEVVAAVKTREEVGALLSNALTTIEGVASLAPALALDVWKFSNSCVSVDPATVSSQKKQLEPLDLSIVECLKKDVRISNRAVATQLDISESAVRVRIKRMQQQKQLAFSAAYRPEGDAVKAAFVGISVQGGTVAAVCRQLMAIPEVSFVCTTLGRHDIMCCLDVTELDRLTQVLHDKIVTIDGVKSTEPSHCLKQLKHQAALGLIL
jgi:Lrp/AsnC family transcriptional regulator for asnA, asnC and gidA